ncbi:MAG: cytochrome c oxidase accessory protein CcoG [Balneolales bacterium]|nr:cytochrome c oxidase accessory protein CcoG [Balneolales bacterium]
MSTDKNQTNQKTINPITEEEHYRDFVSTITNDGKRNWIYPKKPSGRLYNLRTYVSWLLLGFLFAGPFITINGNPLLLMNIFERTFVVFGVVFWPQDFYLFFLAMISFIIFIVLFTAIWGRLFCGWACPQTIFMEMLFRKIEYAIEGDANQQKRLNASPLNREKFFKKTAKHSLFIIISLAIAHTFMAYIIGKDEVLEIVMAGPAQQPVGFIATMVFTALFYGVFARFREQVCLVACPYGRFQSVLVDNDSIAVTYDFERGEGRAKVGERKKVDGVVTNIPKKADSAPMGDCIDCAQCVKVCPTGIDIRNGIQLECINCTACIDACNEVMDKIGKPRELITYTSYNAVVEKREPKVFTTRVKAYLGVFTILFSIFIYLFVTRPEVYTVILREPGMLYNELPGDRYSNFYNAKFFNKTFQDKDVTLQLHYPEGEILWLGNQTSVPGQQQVENRIMVFLSGDNLTGTQTRMEFGVYYDGRLIQRLQTNFIGPSESMRQAPVPAPQP